MSVEIVEGLNYKVLICNTTMTAFGPVFYEDDDVYDFLDYLKLDARRYSEQDLINHADTWRKRNDL